MNKHFPGVRTEHIEMTMPEVAARADVIFSPGYGDDPSAFNQGYVAIDANAKGREAVNAIFPGAPLAWDSNKGLGSIDPAFGPAWQSCAPHLPFYASKYPNTLPEHLVKVGPLDLKSDGQLCFLMAVAADRHGARAAWIDLDQTGRGIKSINFLADQSNNKDEAIVSLDFERLKRNPRKVPLSSNFAREQVRSVLAGRKVHLFELSAPVIAEIARMPMEERLAELEGLREFDLLHLPFGDKEPIALRFNLGALAEKWGLRSDVLEAMRKQTLTVCLSGAVEIMDGREKPNKMVLAMPSDIERELFLEQPGEPMHVVDLDEQPDGGTNLGGMTFEAMTILLLALSDKNIVKRDRLRDAKPKSLRGLTAGPQGMVFVSRTVLEVPEDLPLEPGTHASPRCHRRRGHKRRVAFGVGRTERRWQWFPAVWVNGDPPENWRPTTYEIAS
jgi:hypothetical protein